MFFKLKCPVVLLDIDGVLNPTGKSEGVLETIAHSAGEWNISRTNLNFLVYLSKHAKCFWISPWREESNNINKHIGIKNFKSVFTIDKYDALNKISRWYKNIILISSDICDIRMHCIKVKPSVGLVEEERREVSSYLECFA